MKKIYILCITLSLTLASCSNDDNSADISGDILGTWNMESYTYSGTASTSFQGQSINSSFVAEAFNINYQLTFSENPNIVTGMGDFGITIESTTFGQTETQTINNISSLVPNDQSNSAEWSQSGNQLTFITPERTDVFTILELSDSTLRLDLVLNESVEEEGLIINTNIEADIVFTR